MSENAANRLNLPSDAFFNSVVQFESAFEKARLEGLVNYTPNSEQETYDFNSQQIRIQTIASRLWLLGYLPQKIPSNKITKNLNEIRDAVLKFQEEADLEQDYWVGDKTWYALDELVGFESDITYNKWFLDGNVNPKTSFAFHRAIQLRLWTLGLYLEKPGKRFSLLNTGSLNDFKNVLSIFLINHDNKKFGLNYDTLRILFNQDLLTESLIKRKSTTNKSFMLNLGNTNREKNHQLAETFIVNCAKIELWLLGFDIDIDGRSDFEISNGSKLYNAISNYYQQYQKYESKEAHRLATIITPEFFKGIVEANNINVNPESETFSNEIADILKTENDIKDAWSYIKEKGMRLWDGLKRMWRWIKKIGNQALTYIKENIFIAFFRYASKAYKIVEKGIKEVSRSIDFYFKGEFVVENIALKFSKDMDTSIYISKEANIGEANFVIEKLTKQSAAFNVACRIVSWILKIFRHLTAGFTGVIRLLYSLLKSYNELKLLYTDFKNLATE